MRRVFIYIVFIVSGVFSMTDVFSVSVYAQSKTGLMKSHSGQSSTKKKVSQVNVKPITARFPDGTVGSDYEVTFSSTAFVMPCEISVTSGSLPAGLAIDQINATIKGRPEEQRANQIVFAITDAKKRKTMVEALIPIWRVLTVGKDGQFNGDNGFQMALNMVKDMYEIRVETGTIEASGLEIPSNKQWENAIKITGGWNKTFTENSANPEDTVIDGGLKKVPILTISSDGPVIFQNLMFINSNRGAVVGDAFFLNCVFNHNFNDRGGAVIVSKEASFEDCIFKDNTASDSGGAVYINENSTTFSNCIFDGNSAGDIGGAVYGHSTFTGCIFENNSAPSGGAVGGANTGDYIDSVFVSNYASLSGGAIYGSGTFFNSMFIGNSSDVKIKAEYEYDVHGGGAIHGDAVLKNCMFLNNSDGGKGGGAIEGKVTIVNSTFYGNRAKVNGGAILGGGSIVNSVFYKNIAADKENDIKVDGELEIDFSLFNYLSGAADVGANILTGDPKFVDAGNGDFHLLPGSQCINKGEFVTTEDGENNKTGTNQQLKEINLGPDNTILSSVLDVYRKNFGKISQTSTDSQSEVKEQNNGISETQTIDDNTETIKGTAKANIGEVHEEAPLGDLNTQGATDDLGKNN